MAWVGGEKISHLSNRNEIKWSKTNLFAYLYSCKSSIWVTMTGNNNVYETIWKNGNNEYNEKYICYIFMIWNLKCATTHKCGCHTSVYFAISRLILLFLYSFHVPCIMLSNVCFYFARFMFPFLSIRSQSNVSIVNQMSHLLVETQKYFFCFFQLFENGRSYSQCYFDIDRRCKTRRWK